MLKTIFILLAITFSSISFGQKTPPDQPATDHKKNLERYIGSYELPGKSARVYFKDDETLLLFVPGLPKFQLVPFGKNKFKIKEEKEYLLEFVEGEDGTVSGLIFMQPNKTINALKKPERVTQ